MRPAQFGTQRFPNWISEVKLAHATQFARVQRFAELTRERLCKTFYQSVSVYGTFPAALPVDNQLPDLPIGRHHREIDCGLRFATRRKQNPANGFEQLVVTILHCPSSRIFLLFQF